MNPPTHSMWVEWVFIPAILGYAWLSTSYTDRYDLFRTSGHHVFFRSVIEGYGVFLIAYIVTLIIPDSWFKFMGLNTTYYNMLFVSIILTLLSWSVRSGDKTVNIDDLANKMKENGELVSLLLLESCRLRSQVELTLKNGKSYIGYVARQDYMLNKGGDVALALTASGYRDNETRKLEITTIYDLSELGKSGSINRSDIFGEKGDRGLTLPMSEIVSARFFDHKIYQSYQSKE